jgi:hypothetical protein
MVQTYNFDSESNPHNLCMAENHADPLVITFQS